MNNLFKVTTIIFSLLLIVLLTISWYILDSLVFGKYRGKSEMAILAYSLTFSISIVVLYKLLKVYINDWDK